MAGFCLFVAERARQGGRGAMRLLAFGERAGLWNLRARILHVRLHVVTCFTCSYVAPVLHVTLLTQTSAPRGRPHACIH